MNLGIVIMASGLGKRFGGNKLLADFLGKPVITWILDLLPQNLSAVVVTRHEEVAELCWERRIPVLLHDLPGKGDTIRLGTEYLTAHLPDLDGIVYAVGDQPGLKSETLFALLASFEAAPDGIHRLCYGKKPGNPVIFPKTFFPALCALPKEAGGSVLIGANPDLVRFTQVSSPWELQDVDTPEVLKRLEKAVQEGF